jgi:hypothetical protein
VHEEFGSQAYHRPPTYVQPSPHAPRGFVTYRYLPIANGNCVGDSGKCAIFFVPHMHELDAAISVKRINHGI